MLTKILSNGMKTGFVLAATTTTAIMLASDQENRSPWAAINAIAHIVDGDEKQQPTEYSPRESALGIFVNGTAMSAWGVLYEGTLAVTKIKSNPLTAIAAAAVAYVVDYHVVPKQFTPGIEKKLSAKAVFLAYGVMAATLALSPLWNRSGR